MAKYRVVHDTFFIKTATSSESFQPQIWRWWWPVWTPLLYENCPTYADAAQKCREHADPERYCEQKPRYVKIPVRIE